MKSLGSVFIALLLAGLAAGQAMPADYDGVLKSLGKRETSKAMF
jgi:hypothetical protein